MLSAQADASAEVGSRARVECEDALATDHDGGPATDYTAEALATLLRTLAAQDYRFVTTTPLTHRRILARRAGELASGLRDVFGWNMPFDRSLPGTELVDAMSRAR